MKNLIRSVFILIIVTYFLFLPKQSNAIVDPLSVPNNKFGIHIITASSDEASDAAGLANRNGDWGYVTVLIESKDRNPGKWQQFFDNLRRRHLIPLVRIATKPSGDSWERPYEGEEQAWADFLDNLNWPVKNRYVIVYNEPNHAAEWGNYVDAQSYAITLDKTITALKSKNSDYFVLNAGFDASAPSQPPRYEEEAIFLIQMNEAVPGIFDKLDGWVSHSYPNPGFTGSPTAAGRGTVRTYLWEIQKLRELGLSKKLPVFITETGWKHAEGINYSSFLPDVETVGNYFKTSFETAWNESRIVAVTPFLLNYQEPLFDHFSFKKYNSSEFYSHYHVLADMPKQIGKPVQENKAQLIQGEIFSSVVAGEVYNVSFTIKNTGQSIWNDGEPVRLVPIEGGKALGLEEILLSGDQKIEPGQSFDFNFKIKAPSSGSFKTKLGMFNGNKLFDSQPWEFMTEVKPPVILKIKASLKWKEDFSGIYLLSMSGPSGNVVKQVTLTESGNSFEFEERFLLPDYAYNFTLEKRSRDSGQLITTYKPVTVRQTLYPGVNIIDFGMLDPILFGNIIHPRTFWQLLPFSN